MSSAAAANDVTLIPVAMDADEQAGPCAVTATNHNLLLERQREQERQWQERQRCKSKQEQQRALPLPLPPTPQLQPQLLEPQKQPEEQGGAVGGANDMTYALKQFQISPTPFLPTLVDPTHKQQYEQLQRLHPTGRPLSEYFFFDMAFSKDEIRYILDEYENYPLISGLVGDEVDTSYRNSNIKWIPRNNRTEWLYRKMFQMAMWCQNKYGFNLWCQGEQIQIARYEPKIDADGKEVGGFYDWHCDHGSGSSSLRRLSMSTQLSHPDDYEGGELQLKMNREDKTAPNSQGTVVAFPSYMLHRVQPVTKGVRYSLVNWVSGPPLY